MKLKKLKMEIVRKVSADALKVGAGFVLGVMLISTGVPEVQKAEYKRGFDAGYDKAAKAWHDQYFNSPKNALFLTYDNSGAWLGSTPGAKEAPLYNSFGEQVGRWKDEVNDSVTSSQ